MTDSARQPQRRQAKHLEGLFSVQRVTYCNPESGFAVVHLVPADRQTDTGFVATGTFGQPRTGECYRIEGTWRQDPRHGWQVKITSALPQTPQSIPAIERYLAGATIKGLGPRNAAALVRHFGDQTFQILQEGGKRLEEVPGIGPKRAETIRRSWAEHEGRHQLMIRLQGVARLTPRQAQVLYRQYGDRAWQILTENPYRLADEVRGYGFRTCDVIASHLGIAPDAPERIRAGILYVLRQQLDDGHLWDSETHLVDEATSLLECQKEAVAPQLDALAASSRIVREEIIADGKPVTAIYLPQVRHTEEALAVRLTDLLQQAPSDALRLAPPEARALVDRLGHQSLTDEQRRAVIAVLTGSRLSILTGGPGTGKTTTLRCLIESLEALDVSYALCATTGRASKQLAASTGRPAATVHRHLRIGTGSTVERLRETVLIVDEASMIDLWLMHSIAERLTERSHLLLVGDVDQLPSVGPGAILQDLILLAESGRVPSLAVTRLTQIFRQEAGQESMIVVNCHRVRRGERPIGDVRSTSDYFEMLRETPEEARKLAVDLVARRLPRYLQIPPSEVQILTPVHAGQAGTRALNRALQETLNPPAPGKSEYVVPHAAGDGARRVLRVGDKVRQTRNNYEKQVLNGDIGVIHHIDRSKQVLTVDFDDRSATYDFDQVDELVHAWAMTVHSAQGSQWPAVVVIMLKHHYVMLERNILYTALSRAQRLAVLITQEQAVRMAVSRDRAMRRRTGLIWRAQQTLRKIRPGLAEDETPDGHTLGCLC